MKKLLILSGKGGTGKTTVASAFIAFSNATAMADCDVDAPNLHLALNKTSTPEESDFTGGKKAQADREKCTLCGECARLCRFDAVKIKEDGAYINEIACEGCGVCEWVCPAEAVTLSDDVAGKLMLYRDGGVFSTAELKMGRGNSGKLVSEVKFALYNAARNEPFAVIDGSPGIGCPVIASTSGADLVLAVAEPSVSGISDLGRLYKTAQRLGVPFAVCVNKYDVNLRKTEEIEEFCKINGIAFTGRIPFDKSVPHAINNSLGIVGVKCAARDALEDIYGKTMLLLR